MPLLRSGAARALLCLLVATAGAGCATVVSTGVNQTGPNSYTLAVRAGRAQGGAVGAEGMAMEEAGDFCRRQGRQILVSSQGAARGTYRVAFRCMAANAPEFVQAGAAAALPLVR